MVMDHLLLLETVNLHKELKVQSSVLYSLLNQSKIKISSHVPFQNTIHK